MAKFVLANRIVFDGILLRPGKIVDDSAYDTARMTASGAILIATPNAVVEARALAIRTAQAKGEAGVELDLLSAASSESGGGGGGVPAGRTLTAGTGLTGGGDLSADRTFAIGVIPFANVAAALLLANASINVNSQKIVSLLDPTAPQDAATKAYVDAHAGGGTPTGTGFFHVTGGVMDAASVAVNLATADVTGVLPSANMATATAGATGAVQLAGDLGGTGTAAATPKVGALTGVAGTLALASTAAIVQWAAASTAPTIIQATQGSDIATNDLSIQSQNPFATATGTNRKPGNIVLKLAAPIAGGTEAKISLTFAGTEMGAFQKTSPTTVQFITPTSGVFAITGTGAASQFNITTGSSFFAISDTLFIYNGNGMAIGTSGLTTAQRFGGGFYVVYQANASTLPTTNPTTGHIWYSDGGCPAYRTSAGNVMKWDGISAATANAGAGGALPATISEYMTITYNGNTRKIPLYLT